MIPKMTKFPSTKTFDEGDAVATELTLDFTGLTDADIQEIAAGACVIKWQSKVRNSKKPIPTKDTYIVPRPGTRAVAAPMTDEQLIAELEKRGLINQVLKKVEDEYEEVDKD
jgi:hypothetical protein